MILRSYQQRAVDKVRQMTGGWPVSLCVQGPTGSGKSLMMAELLTDPLPQMVITHRRILLDQLSRVLSEYGVEHGIRAAGFRPNPSARVQIAMVQTESNRQDSEGWEHFDCERLHIDEIHAIKSKMAQKIIDKQRSNSRPSVIGWTATPKEIGHICEHLVVATTVPELTPEYLSPHVVYTPDGPDCDRLETVKRTISGDFMGAQTEKVWRPRVIFGRVVEHLQRLNPDLRPTALFAGGVPDSIWFAEKLSAKGIPSAHIDAKHIRWRGEVNESTPENREWLFSLLCSGECKVVCNRFVLREGWDCPPVGHIILATAFGSRTSFVQACGRGLRPAPGKNRCVFQDHGGNFWRFPPLDDDRPWSMDLPEREQHKKRIHDLRSGAELQPIVCPKCSALRSSGGECPQCGHKSKRGSRMVVEVDGQLRRVSSAMFKRRVRRAKTIEDKWVSTFWGFRKYRPNYKLEAAYCALRFKTGRKDIPRDLKFMPLSGKGSLWGEKIGTISLRDLR